MATDLTRVTEKEISREEQRLFLKTSNDISCHVALQQLMLTRLLK